MQPWPATLRDEMTLDQLLSLLATILGAIGTIYVLKSILRLTPYITERLSATRYGHNPDMIDSLSAQKADGIVGASLVVLALGITIVNAMITPPGIGIYPDKLQAILMTFVLTTIVVLPTLLVGKIIDSNNRRATVRIIIAAQLDRLFKSNNIPNSEIRSLRSLAERYFNLKSTPNDPPLDWLRRIAKYVDRTVPDNIVIEA